MKRIITFMLAVMIIISMTFSVCAATPAIKIPNIPQISNINFNIKLDKTVETGINNYVKDWFTKNPISFELELDNILLGK